MDFEPLILKPIGIFLTDKKNRYEADHQSSSLANHIGIIELNSLQNFEQALDSIDQCSHLWILFQFHLNKNWKPMTLTPRGPQNKIGVFSTRSPYRPNPIGMSAVQLIKRDRLKLFVQGADLLDRTPILDIKPYHPDADSIPDAKIGWLEESLETWTVELSGVAEKQLAILKELGVLQIEDFIFTQLRHHPIDEIRKRVSPTTTPNIWILSYRTWRIKFQATREILNITIQEIFSGYSHQELVHSEDKYQDKALHRDFQKRK